MRNGYRILDADRHVIEPIDMWRDYLPPAFRGGAPYHEIVIPRETLAERVARLGDMGLIPLPATMMLDGQPVWQRFPERAQLELARTSYLRPGLLGMGASAEGQLASMDRTGVDVAMLFPSFASYLVGIDSMEPARASAFAGAYNDWLRSLCRAAPDRLRPVGLLSRHDPEAMVAELERVHAFGFRAVVLRPNPIKGRLLGDPAYEPFYAACERLSVAVAVHDGTHARVPTAGDRFATHFAMHACSHPMEQMMAFLSLLESGVLERHPGLRFAFLEAGCGWLPYWLSRLDTLVFENLGGEVSEHVRQRPSVYFRRQCLASVDPHESYLPDLLPHLGGDSLVFGSDFPHPDHDVDAVDQVLKLEERIGRPLLERILWENPRRFYGIE